MKRHLIQQIGALLGISGAALLGTVFLVVLLNGRWPEMLRPVQGLFQAISDWTGEAALIFEIWLFVGPGALVYYWGKHLTEKQQRNAKSQ